MSDPNSSGTPSSVHCRNHRWRSGPCDVCGGGGGGGGRIGDVPTGPIGRGVLTQSAASELRIATRVVTRLLLPLRMIRIDVEDHAVVDVAPEDLGAWIGALDLSAPDWDVTAIGTDWLSRSAVWPERVFEGLGFRISSSDLVPLAGVVSPGDVSRPARAEAAS